MKPLNDFGNQGKELGRILKEAEKIAGEAENSIEKKEMPPLLKLDVLIENCSNLNIKKTIDELQVLLNKHPEIKEEFKEKMKWEYEDAETKRKSNDAETQQRAFHRLQTLTEINRKIN